jgi:hypothetical protein
MALNFIACSKKVNVCSGPTTSRGKPCRQEWAIAIPGWENLPKSILRRKCQVRRCMLLLEVNQRLCRTTPLSRACDELC